MRVLQLPDLALALRLGFGFSNFDAVFVVVSDKNAITYSDKAVRVGEFVIDADQPPADTTEAWISLMLGLKPKLTLIGRKQVVGLYKGDRLIVMVVREIIS